MKSQIFLVAAAMSLGSCATVYSVAVDEHDKSVANAPKGFPYYEPDPYLVVTELPVAQTPAGGGNVSALALKPGGSGSGNQSDDQKQPETAAPASSGADTSFAASMASYSMKIVYFPDWTRRRMLKLRPGLLGSSSAAPTFQDGWMLNSLNGSADNGVASTIAAITGGGGAGSKASGGSGGASKAAALSQLSAALGVQSLSAANQDALVKAVLAAQQQGSPDTRPIWGSGVLPPGMYSLRHLPLLSPVAFFCKDGIHLATTDSQGKVVPPEACAHSY